MTDLISLLGRKEREDLENKLIIRLKNERDKSRFSERVSAIANRSGGHIIVGVDDRQQLIGINPEEIDEEQIQQVVAERCNPPVDLSSKMISQQGKFFVIIKILKRKGAPHQIRKTGAIWIRQGTISRPATVDEIYEMMKEFRGAEPSLEFLINGIYSPLYEEIRMIVNNISELKPYLQRRYGRPNFSAPLPRDKVPGSIRKTMILTGKYEIVPKNLRMILDEFYNECEEYNKLLSEKYNKIFEKQRQILDSSESLIKELKKKILNPLN